MKVLVVGGGVVGLGAANALARDGHEVVVVRRDDPVDATSSWVAGGLLTPSTPWRYPAPLIDMCLASEAMYPDFVEELATFGVDPELERVGVLYPAGLAVSDEDIAEAGRRRRAMGFGVEELDRAELDRVQPGLSDAVTTAGWQPDAARVRPPRILKALGSQAEALDVDEVLGTVVALDVAGDCMRGVTLEDGATLGADVVVLAAGAWSSQLLGSVDVELAVGPVRGQMLLLRGEPGELGPTIIDGDSYLIPRRDGRVLVGSTMEHVGFDATTTDEALDELRAFARRLFPSAATMTEERAWAGLRPGTPDRLPYLGAVEGVDGLVVATGHFRNGILLAPITARIVADVVAGRTPPVDLTPFTARRPADLAWQVS